MFIETKCYLCKSDTYDDIYPEKLLTEAGKVEHDKISADVVENVHGVVRCCRCGLCFLSQREEDERIEKRYVFMNDELYLREERGRRAVARRILAQLKKIKSKGRLLDIGCATGFLLDEARKHGWEVYGVELSEWAIRYARETLGLSNITQGRLKDADFKPGYFDVVVMMDVIEQLTDPKATLEEIRQVLTPNGVLCVTTPNIDSLISRVLKAKWWGTKEAHLYYFNESTIKRLLTTTGFYLFAIRSYTRTFSLGHWFSSWAAYKPSIKAIVRFFNRHPKISSMLLSLDLGDQMVIFSRRSRQMKYLVELEDMSLQESFPIQKRVIAVLPAYNAAKTLKATVRDIPMDIVQEIILVDDASQDNTFDVARQLGINVIRHDRNKGYGGNQKTCYRRALELNADVVIMVHPDYQYDPKMIPQLVEPILKGQADAVFGSRMMKGGALIGGMPIWKYNANILLTALENIILGIYLTEYHSGFRAYSRHYLASVNFEANSNNFVFDTEIIVQGVIKYMRFEEVPIRTRYFDEASSIKLWPSIIYGCSIFGILLKFFLHKTVWHMKQFE